MAEALIATEDLVKDYHLGTRRIHALRKVSVSIEPGEFVAVMGPSGSGKSTFMNLLGCLDTPTAGQYRLDGLDVSRMGRDRLARVRNEKIGFVFQTFNLLPRTSALENVELPLLYSATLGRDRQARARAKLAAVGLSEREHHHPAGVAGDVSLVGHHHHRDALPVEVLEERHDLHAGMRVERAGGLVGQDQDRIIDEGARDGHALLLPT